MSKAKKHILWIAILAVAVIFLVAFFWGQQRSSYEWVSPKTGNVVEAIYGLGKVKSHRKYEVKVGIITTVKKVWVKEGQMVRKGDPLIQFATTAAFHAPFDGTVTSVAFNEPETVFPQVTTVAMQDLEDIYLEVSLEQEGALRVKPGQEAVVLFESLRGERFTGKVESVFPHQDEFITHISVEGLDNNVLPGMTADVSITVGNHKDVLLVPVAGLSNGQLNIRRDGKKQKVKVRVGGIDGEWAEVVDGDVSVNDEVLVRKAKGA